jgi:hypothetical protein
LEEPGAIPGIPLEKVMTKLRYRNIEYDRDAEHKAFQEWWSMVHRPTLWLRYRGIKYRPAQNDTYVQPAFQRSIP